MLVQATLELQREGKTVSHGYVRIEEAQQRALEIAARKPALPDLPKRAAHLLPLPF